MNVIISDTFKPKGRLKHSVCGHGVVSVDNYERTGDTCPKCYPQSDRSFFVPDLKPFFNRGLGCVTHGTRDAEKKAKRMGLTPVGDAKVSEWHRKDTRDTITPILEEGHRKLHTLNEVR